MSRPDFDTISLIRQLTAELDEAQGQLTQARNILQNLEQQAQDYGYAVAPRERWLAWHKCCEARENLSNVAHALEKGAQR